MTVLNGFDKSVPPEVKKEISEFWELCEMGDMGYVDFSAKFADEEMYPNLIKFLKDNNVEECLLDYGW
jgi:hypothetical protein